MEHTDEMIHKRREARQQQRIAQKKKQKQRLFFGTIFILALIVGICIGLATCVSGKDPASDEPPQQEQQGTQERAKYVRAVRNERQITITAGSYTGKSLGTGSIYAYGFQNSRVAANDNGSATITGGYYHGEAGTKGFGMNMDYSNLVTVGGTVEVSGSRAAV